MKRNRNLVVATLTLVLSMVATTSQAALSKSEARDELLAYLMRNPQTKKVEVVRDYLNQYRVGSAPAVLNLKMAPYPRFLIGTQIGTIYPAVYQAQWEVLTSEPALDLLFDGFMQMIIKGTVKGDLKKSADQIGERMARQVLRGASPFCKLDLSEKPARKISTWTLLRLKADVLNLAKPCTYRKTIFAEAKSQLIKARKDPKVIADFKAEAIKVFPTEFRKQFTTQLSDEVKDFSSLVVAKFGGELHPIWGENGGIIEDIEGQAIADGMQNISLYGFAHGLRTDLAAAAVLKNSNDKMDRGLAAGLFYAVVNRLLYLTGSDQIKWDMAEQKMVVNPPMAAITRKVLTHEVTQDVAGKEVIQETYEDTFNGPWAVVFLDPKTPPLFDYQAFGGWGFEKKDQGRASNWDWGNYQPDADKNPSALRLFASRFKVNTAGLVQPGTSTELVQESKAIGEMIQAVADFMKATAPGGPFGQYFGGEENIGDLLDPEKPMLFPTDGRKLAVGVIAALAQNLLDPKTGHVQETDSGIHLAFRDRSTFDSVATDQIRTEGVASLLSAAADLRESLRSDPILEQEDMKALKEVGPKLETLLQLGTLALGAAAQMPDGRMTEFLFTPSEQFSVKTQISGMRAMMKAFNQTRLTLLQVRLADGWKAMIAGLSNDASKPIHRTEKLEVNKIWDDTQIYLREQHREAPWQDWEKQLRGLSGL